MGTERVNPRFDFLRRYGFTEEQFQQTGLEWVMLDEVRQRHTDMLAELETTAKFVVERLQTVPAVHSLKSGWLPVYSMPIFGLVGSHGSTLAHRVPIHAWRFGRCEIGHLLHYCSWPLRLFPA